MTPLRQRIVTRLINHIWGPRRRAVDAELQMLRRLAKCAGLDPVTTGDWEAHRAECDRELAYLRVEVRRLRRLRGGR